MSFSVDGHVWTFSVILQSLPAIWEDRNELWYDHQMPIRSAEHDIEGHRTDSMREPVLALGCGMGQRGDRPTISHSVQRRSENPIKCELYSGDYLPSNEIVFVSYRDLPICYKFHVNIVDIPL